ncbi:MAG: response regulator [Algoriphagus sp.]|nr:response regulator [Algoriphagus sp.]
MHLLKIQKILVLDDDKIQHLLFRKKLGFMFPEVVLFFKTTPSEAIDFLQENKVDLIFLDLNLPEMSGWDLVELLKKNSIESRLILVTGSVSTEDNERVKNDGFIHAIYEKPISESDLQEILGD